MFQTDKQPATCAHYNATAEKRGKDDFVPAGDVKLKMVVSNTVLDEFGPDYRAFLYSKANAKPVKRDRDEPEQTELMPAAPEDGLTALAHPLLEPLKLREKYTGYRLGMAAELELCDPLEFSDVTLSGFVFKPLDGGSVELTFHARIVDLSPEDSGALHFFSRQNVLLTLVPPAAAPHQAHIEDGAAQAA
ncbi:hypothetical protein [Lysobacter enzymogenes]|uniref:hypothetical protein n=1 Tax=Lysobacter enzymogenes TaxID=69 RepID=UPI0008941FE5|nr:hypothetical protein [Lysobacter enzymogenes]SDY08484.1 hypothetical protein SAMN05421681_110193 [Lysobacter enzymogenes]